MANKRHPDKKQCTAWLWGWEKEGGLLLVEEHDSNQSHILRAALLSFEALDAQEQKKYVNLVEAEELANAG